MGILSGLSNLGLENLEKADLYEKGEEKKPEIKATEPEKKVISEEDFLFDKTFKCPVCDTEIKARTVKANRARMIGQDVDLRPKYDLIDPLKYDVVACRQCGYASIAKYFSLITPPQAKLIKENISKKFKAFQTKSVFSYDDAIERHQLALANAIVKRAKSSEKAYICLKLAWLVRGKMETYDLDADDYDDVMRKSANDERELLKNALSGFIDARRTENFPICGMDEGTVDYLIAALSVKFEEYDTAIQMLSAIMSSYSANKRIKDKARDLKDQIFAVRGSK